MEGPNIHDTDYRGVLPRAIEKVMALVENPPSGTTVSVGVSHIEIYLERVQDLLQMDKANLAVREDTSTGRASSAGQATDPLTEDGDGGKGQKGNSQSKKGRIHASLVLVWDACRVLLTGRWRGAGDDIEL